jgi:hypothetical protein
VNKNNLKNLTKGFGSSGRIFNGQTAIKTKVADVVFSTTEGDLHFKVIRAETYIKDNGKWYFVLVKKLIF